MKKTMLVAAWAVISFGHLALASTTTPFLNPLKLDTGQTYVTSKQTPLMPSHSPADVMEALKKAKSIPAGKAFKILCAVKKNGQPWYKVAVFDRGIKQTILGWINSTALIGQKLKIATKISANRPHKQIINSVHYSGIMIKINHTTGEVSANASGITEQIFDHCLESVGTNAKLLKYCIQSQTNNAGTSKTNYPSNTKKATNITTNSIDKNCADKWGNDYRMVEYCIDKQTAAKNHLAGQNISTDIRHHCKDKWGNDYRMVEYCVDTQVAAKRKLSQ